MKCPGLHCDGCRSGGGGLVALAAVIVICAIVARPVVHAADELGHVIAEILRIILVAAEIAGITAAAAAAIAAAVVITGRTRRRAALRAAGRRETERQMVDAILEREQLALAPRTWQATVLRPEQQQIPTPTGDRS